MGNRINSSKVTVRSTLLKLISGFDEHFAGQTLVLNGVSGKPADFATRWQAYIAAEDAADVAKAAWLGKVDAAKQLAATVAPEVIAAHSFVRSVFGTASPALADFGMTARRVTDNRTVAEKTQAVEKALATRQVRHTMGPKQKAAIHGSVPAAPAAPALPSTAATPAVVKGGSGQS